MTSTASDFVRAFREDVLTQWRRAARQLPITRDMSSTTLLDRIPALLDEIADIADEIMDDCRTSPVFETARRHALDRLGDGFDVATIVGELSLLRDAIFSVWIRRTRDARRKRCAWNKCASAPSSTAASAPSMSSSSRLW